VEGGAGQPSGWELLYRNSPTVDREVPHEAAARLHEVFREHEVRSILDLGCGDGRHLTFFSRLGYDVVGLDNAPTGLRLSRAWLDREGLPADLVCAEMTMLPFADGSFDAVISFQAIYHNPIAGIRRSIREIRRVLRPHGWHSVTVSTMKEIGPMRFRNGREIEPGTYVMERHREQGVPHHFFTTAELFGEYADFKIVDFRWDSRSRACLLTRKRE
jgi:SAM-dependent methyltransferase